MVQRYHNHVVTRTEVELREKGHHRQHASGAEFFTGVLSVSSWRKVTIPERPCDATVGTGRTSLVRVVMWCGVRKCGDFPPTYCMLHMATCCVFPCSCASFPTAREVLNGSLPKSVMDMPRCHTPDRFVNAETAALLRLQVRGFGAT